MRLLSSSSAIADAPPSPSVHTGQTRGSPTRPAPYQGQLVLIQSVGQPGASNRPAETADAHSHAGTVNTANRPAAAVAVAPIAANASPPPSPRPPASPGH